MNSILVCNVVPTTFYILGHLSAPIRYVIWGRSSGSST